MSLYFTFFVLFLCFYFVYNVVYYVLFSLQIYINSLTYTEIQTNIVSILLIFIVLSSLA